MAALFSFPSQAPAVPLPPFRVLSLNLHGYHPMSEPLRYAEKIGQEPKLTEPYLTYFTPEEIRRGQTKQLTTLQEQITSLSPDLILLQEVGAGLPETTKDCAEFYREEGGDTFGRNSALRLRDRLNARGAGYDTALACRANIGWRTDENTFANTRIWRGEGAARELVHDFGANPYPQGFIVEGTAILARAPWRLEDPRIWNIPLAKAGETFFFQGSRLRYADSAEWLLVVNVHGRWNVRHFEAAVELRRQVDSYVSAQPDRAAFRGFFIGGDFNAPLFRPRTGAAEVSGLPWEVSRPGEFNFGADAGDEAWKDLSARLWALSFKDGKYTAELGPEAEARQRTEEAVFTYRSFVESGVPERLPLQEALTPQTCSASRWPAFEAACTFPKRIDLLFHSPGLVTRAATVLWSSNTFFTTEGVSDHPGLLVDLALK
jgi:hypothetical protein